MRRRLLIGCPAAAQWLQDTFGTKTHRQTIRTATINGELPALNADEYGLHGTRYIFSESDLEHWYMTKMGVTKC